MVSNKKAGTQFEREFARLLADNHFWVHLFRDNQNGQPCDLIASRSGHAYLFDCKDCQGNFFPISRMEENQYNAMHLFELTGNSRGKLAIRFAGRNIYLVDYWQIKALKEKGLRLIDQMDCKLFGEEFSIWLNTRNQIDGWSNEDANINRQRDKDNGRGQTAI